MTPITTSQARTRFTTLPPTLQDAVFSEQTAEIIASTIEKFHLADHRAEDIPTLVGWVLLGFLHIEDLAAEIETAARVPKPLAKEIADSLTVKIFEPLRGALAQFHAPVPDAMTGVAPEATESTPVRISIEGMSAAPKIISGTTFTATPGSQKNVIIGPKVTQEIKPAGGTGTPGAGVNAQGAPGTAGSTAGFAGNIGKPIPHFEPKPNIGGAMATPTASAQKPKSSGEFARLASQGGAPTPTPAIKPLVPVTPTPSMPPKPSMPTPTPSTPATPAAPQAPKPMMLQSNASPKPIQNAPNLGNAQKAVDILAGKKMPVPLPMRPTVIEIGSAPKTAGAPSASSTQPPAPRTVDYSAIKNTSPVAPNRQITEITAAANTPLPAMQMPPRGEIQKAPTPMVPATTPTQQAAQPAQPKPITTPISTSSLPPKPPMPVSFQKPALLPITPTSTTQPKPQPLATTAPTTSAKPAGLSPIIVKNFTEGEK